jgi:hypothetical protein
MFRVSGAPSKPCFVVGYDYFPAVAAGELARRWSTRRAGMMRFIRKKQLAKQRRDGYGSHGHGVAGGETVIK